MSTLASYNPLAVHIDYVDYVDYVDYMNINILI